MSSTNKTTYYELPQFVNNDIFNPLVDDNDAYNKIDTALHNIANAEADDASEIVGVKSRLDSAEGDIDALEAQNGSEVLNTTKQTLSGAVNELDSDVSALDGRLDIVENDINNASTGLKAKTTAMQGEINNLTVFVTPQMFGAVGDGVHDDTQAFVDAIATRKKVVVPKGEYNITNTITLIRQTTIEGIDYPVINCNKKLFYGNHVGYFLNLKGLDIRVKSNVEDSIIDLTDVKYLKADSCNISNFTGDTDNDLLYTALEIKRDTDFSGYIYLENSKFSGSVGLNIKASNASAINCDFQSSKTAVIDACESLNIIGCCFTRRENVDTYIINNDYIHYMINCYFEPTGDHTINIETENGKLGKLVPIGGKYNYSALYPNVRCEVEGNTFYGNTMLGIAGNNLLVDNWGELSNLPEVDGTYGKCWRETDGYGISIPNAVYLIAGKEYTLSTEYVITDGTLTEYLSLIKGDHKYACVLDIRSTTLTRGALVFTCEESGFYSLQSRSGSGANRKVDYYTISVCEGRNYSSSTQGKVNYPSLSMIKNTTDNRVYDISYDGRVPCYRRHDRPNDNYEPMIKHLVTETVTVDADGKATLAQRFTTGGLVLGCTAQNKFAELKATNTYNYVFITNYDGTIPANGTEVVVQYWYVPVIYTAFE